MALILNHLEMVYVEIVCDLCDDRTSALFSHEFWRSGHDKKIRALFPGWGGHEAPGQQGMLSCPDCSHSYDRWMQSRRKGSKTTIHIGKKGG